MVTGEQVRQLADPTLPDRLLEVVGTLAGELKPTGRPQPAATWESRFESDLGLDSLARAELLERVGEAFGLILPDDSIQAQTPRELLQILRDCGPGPARFSLEQFAPLPEVTGAPDRAGSLLEVLQWHVEHHAGRIHLYVYDEDAVHPVTYGELDTASDAVAGGLLAEGLQQRETVAIMLPTGLDYFHAFFGILKAGGIPVPIYPPARPAQLAEHLRRHGRILANAGARWLLADDQTTPIARLMRAEGVGLERIRTVTELGRYRVQLGVAPSPGDLALLQYTSGSTGDPKGVTLTHANLLANIRALGERLAVTSADVFVSWLPLYHDMGLIGAWLGSLYFAVPLVVMSPQAFLARPQRWLWAIHSHRATLSAAPNFGYELCLRHVDDARAQGLDLSSWRYAFNGAEPVSPDTLEGFNRRFAAYGLRPEVLQGVYGLAECAVALAIPPPDHPAVIERVRRAAFMNTGVAQPATDDDPTALRFVRCGPALGGHELRVVNANGRELPERCEGHLQFRGPSATAGYYHNPEATGRLIRDGWLDTGDCGYLVDGTVVITGRLKDVVIRGGRNIHPQELEQAVSARPGIRTGCVAVFGSRSGDGPERLIVAAESHETDPATLTRLRADIEQATLELLGVAADDVRLLPPQSVLKTSSGKIRRAATRELYESGQLGRPGRAVWRQLAGLQVAATRRSVLRRLHGWGQLLYAGYAWTVFGAGALAAFATLPLLPTQRARWRAIRTILAACAGLAGVRIECRGAEHLPASGRCMLVANHASYLDGPVLARVLPRPFRFVAKAELASGFFARTLLGQLGTLFVERFDPAESLKGADSITEALRGDSAIVSFPEGTLHREAGLHDFRMGAFAAAAATGAPVIPAAISGTRAIVLAQTWFPRRGRVSIAIGEPVYPDGNDWPAAVRLRDRASSAVAALLGGSESRE